MVDAAFCGRTKRWGYRKKAETLEKFLVISARNIGPGDNNELWVYRGSQGEESRTIYRGYGHLELLGERACIVIEN